MFQSLIGLVILSLGLVGTAIFYETINLTDLTNESITPHEIAMREVHLWYSLQQPPIFAMVAAAILGLLAALFFISLEIRDINISRRSHIAKKKPLAPKILMDQTRGFFYGEVTVTVVIPAHNEEKNILLTIQSLAYQHRQPDRVIVVADNCTDKTIEIAYSQGVEVIPTKENSRKKAGALNQALLPLIEQAGPNDTFMIMDADTRLKPEFIEEAVRHFTDDRGLSAIGGLFYGEEGHGLIGQLQRNEYLRYQREINRRKGRVFVLTGTASIFRAQALKEVAHQRGKLLPGVPGEIYDTLALTEDNEITIALKTLGALMTSPAKCQVETELMPNWSALWRQRLRWERGAIENIGAYGITGTTTRYWSQQLGIAYSTFALWTYFLLIFIQVFASPIWIWYPFWILAGVIFILERIMTVWDGGWRARTLALFLIPELLHDFFLDVIFVKGTVDIVLKRNAKWGHEVEDSKRLSAK